MFGPFEIMCKLSRTLVPAVWVCGGGDAPPPLTHHSDFFDVAGRTQARRAKACPFATTGEKGAEGCIHYSVYAMRIRTF